MALHIDIVTLFPEFFEGPLSSALMKRARESGIVSFGFHNPRDEALDKHRTVDDRPYGGGPGMVMLPEPIAAVLRKLGFRKRGEAQPGRLFYLSPKGTPFTQAFAVALAAHEATGGNCEVPVGDRETPERSGAAQSGGYAAPARLALICGRYEGMDARIEEYFPVETVSVGDFVLNGGEAAALCFIEAVCRLLPGFMGHEDSGEEESFSAGLLEYPHYTRPEEFEGLAVPSVLRSGDHGRIGLWRRQAALWDTLAHRPDLLEGAALTEADVRFLHMCRRERHGRNLYCALVHHPVLDKNGKSVAVSLTNLDIHDIARSSYTYGLGGYYVITPFEDQQELLQSVLAHWSNGPGKVSNPDRDAALSLVRGGASIAEAVADVTHRTGEEPLVIGTAARFASESEENGVMSFSAIAETLRRKPVLLLFGTGHGLAPEARALCRAFAPPVRWHGGYNHLSVRAAAAIIFDRIVGDWR